MTVRVIMRKEQGADNFVKYQKLLIFLLTAIIIPLWIDLIKDIIKQIPWLYYTVIVITTLLLLVIVVLIVRELLNLFDTWYTFQCRRIDYLVNKTRKKLQRIIARTNDASVMDHALVKLYKIYKAEIYSSLLDELIENERNPAKRITLQAYTLEKWRS